MKQSIEGWVARDSKNDGSRLNFFEVKPERHPIYGYWRLPKGQTDARTKTITTTLFFDVNIKWEDEPRKVKITIEYDD